MPAVYTTDHKWFRKQVRLLKMIASNTAGGGAAAVASPAAEAEPAALSVGAEFIVGGGAGAPAAGDFEYNNEALVGKSLMVFRNGVGFLTEGIEYDPLHDGGIILPGCSPFVAGDKWILFIRP